MKILVSCLSLAGFLAIFYGLVGGICGMFNYVLIVKGATLPLIGIPGMIAMIVIGAGCLLLARMLNKKMQKQQQSNSSN